MATTNNGQTRKSLADQIDRLDGVIDALSMGLNEAVATVVETAVEKAVTLAVQQAVQAALTEVLTNPRVLGRLREVINPPVPEPTRSDKEKTKPGMVGSAWHWLCERVRSTVRVCSNGIHAVGQAVSLAWSVASRPVRAVIVGGVTVAAGTAYLVRRQLASAVSSVLGLGRSLVEQARDRLVLALARGG
jgi:hypothetical protein